jgi:hypothetical protein
MLQMMQAHPSLQRPIAQPQDKQMEAAQALIESKTNQTHS